MYHKERSDREVAVDPSLAKAVVLSLNHLKIGLESITHDLEVGMLYEHRELLLMQERFGALSTKVRSGALGPKISKEVVQIAQIVHEIRNHEDLWRTQDPCEKWFHLVRTGFELRARLDHFKVQTGRPAISQAFPAHANFISQLKNHGKIEGDLEAVPGPLCGECGYNLHGSLGYFRSAENSLISKPEELEVALKEHIDGIGAHRNCPDCGVHFELPTALSPSSIQRLELQLVEAQEALLKLIKKSPSSSNTLAIELESLGPRAFHLFPPPKLDDRNDQ